MSLPDKVKRQTAKFLLDKALQLEMEHNRRKKLGEKKILDIYNEMHADLKRLKEQIKSYRDKAKAMSDQ